MECNKEEAIRAKDIAEQKMQNNDFVGAKKALVKAQQLFPDLDNISQMVAVCEVHCCAGVKVNGEMDWYGVLQVESTTDEPSIRNQYRTLALLLHPDKNKFAGADGAFKLIGEARSMLSDSAKRALYDSKRKSNIGSVPAWQPSYYTTADGNGLYQQQPSQPSNNTTAHCYDMYQHQQSQPSNNTAAPANRSYQQRPYWTFNSRTTHLHQQYMQQQPWPSNNTAARVDSVKQLHQQPSVFSAPQTFCTICHFCGWGYTLDTIHMNRGFFCQQCSNIFIARYLNGEAVPDGGSSGYSANHSPTINDICGPSNAPYTSGFQGNAGRGNPGIPSTMGFHGDAGGEDASNASSSVGFQGNAGGGNPGNASSTRGFHGNAGGEDAGNASSVGFQGNAGGADPGNASSTRGFQGNAGGGDPGDASSSTGFQGNAGGSDISNAGGGDPGNAASSTGFQGESLRVPDLPPDFSHMEELAARHQGEKKMKARLKVVADPRASFDAERVELEKAVITLKATLDVEREAKRKDMEELQASLDRARASEVAQLKLCHASELEQLQSVFEAQVLKALTAQKAQLEAANTDKFKAYLASLSSCDNEKEAGQNGNAGDAAEQQRLQGPPPSSGTQLGRLDEVMHSGSNPPRFH